MSSDHKPSRKRLMLMGVGGLTLAALLVANGLHARTMHEQSVSAWTETAAIPQVMVFQPKQNVAGDTLRLPAHLEAWSKAPITARPRGEFCSSDNASGNMPMIIARAVMHTGRKRV